MAIIRYILRQSANLTLSSSYDYAIIINVLQAVTALQLSQKVILCQTYMVLFGIEYCLKFGLKPQKELKGRLSDGLFQEGTVDLMKVVAILGWKTTLYNRYQTLPQARTAFFLLGHFWAPQTSLNKSLWSEPRSSQLPPTAAIKHCGLWGHLQCLRSFHTDLVSSGLLFLPGK